MAMEVSARAMARAALSAAVLLAAAPVARGGDAGPAADSGWGGASGFPAPMEGGAPVEVSRAKAIYTAIPPRDHGLEDPRFAERWEVLLGMTLVNASEERASVTLGLPEVPLDPASGEPVIGGATFTLDGRRAACEEVDEPGPEIPGAPRFRVSRKLEVELEPGRERRVEAFFRTPARVEDGATVLRVIDAGLFRFAGGSVDDLKIEVRFGERVRLVEHRGERFRLAVDPPPGVETWFFDDGRNTRMQIGSKGHAPGRGRIELAARPVGLRSDRPGGPSLLGEMKPLARMTPAELETARLLYLALHGRIFFDREILSMFADRPWNECHPGYLVAHGRPLGASTIEEFLSTRECDASCDERRRKSVDPYGSPWEEPVCWYSPVKNASRTQVKDPEIIARLAEIDRLQKADAERDAPGPGDRAQGAGGCGCRAAAGAAARAASLLELLLGGAG